MKIFSILLLFFLLSGCEIMPEPQNIKLPEINLPDIKEDISKLGMNDIIEIKVYGEPELARVYRIDSSGEILYPMIGKIIVLEKTPNEVSAVIEKRLNEKYFKNAQVTIFVKERRSKKVYVLGEVKKPGAYPYQTDLTLLQLISTSGGFTNIANRNKVILKRTIGHKTHSISIPSDRIISGKIPDITLFPNDVVYIPESWL